jgi:hypothetical protein
MGDLDTDTFSKKSTIFTKLFDLTDEPNRVSNRPGQMQLTLTPLGPNSIDITWLNQGLPFYQRISPHEINLNNLQIECYGKQISKNS